jgi:hypothetical protein
MKNIRYLLILLLVITACNKESNRNAQQLHEKSVQSKAEPITNAEETNQSTVKTITLEGDDIILAQVNDTAITQYDVNQSIENMFDPETIRKIGKTERDKILESLIKSRAIAHAFEKMMTPEDQAVVEKKVKSYREQLLVKMYLVRKTNPEPVTLKMVKDYYDAHPEKFGGKTIRVYEMIASKDVLEGETLARLLKQLKKSPEHTKWNQWASNLQQKGYPVIYRKGEVSEKILQPKLAQAMKLLSIGETSKITFVRGKCYLFIIIDEKIIEPLPLSEVSTDIRKALVPMQLKKSIKSASKQVIKDTKIFRKIN